MIKQKIIKIISKIQNKKNLTFSIFKNKIFIYLNKLKEYVSDIKLLFLFRKGDLFKKNMIINRIYNPFIFEVIKINYSFIKPKETKIIGKEIDCEEKNTFQITNIKKIYKLQKNYKKIKKILDKNGIIKVTMEKDKNTKIFYIYKHYISNKKHLIYIMENNRLAIITIENILNILDTSDYNNIKKL